MKTTIIVSAMFLAALCNQPTMAQSTPEGRLPRPQPIGMHAYATVVDGLHISGYIRGLLLSDTNTGAPAYEIEVYGTSLAIVSLGASGNLKSTPCRVVNQNSVPTVKQARYCGVHTIYTSAILQFIQEVL